MEPLLIEATKSTPAVHFDVQTHQLEIRGESYPENAFEFYAPLFAWIDAFLAQLDAAAVLTLRLEYLNTSSTRCLLTLLDKFEDAAQHDKAVEVKWYYHPEDDRALETAEEFKEDLTLPFEIIAEKED